MSQIDGKKTDSPERKIQHDVNLVEGDNLGSEDGLIQCQRKRD